MITPPGLVRYMPNSQYTLAKVTFPSPSVIAAILASSDKKVRMWWHEHGGALYNPNLNTLGNWANSVIGTELRRRGAIIIDYEYPPAGKYQLYEGSFSWESPQSKLMPRNNEYEMMERAYFPDCLQYAARVVQYFKTRANDYDFINALYFAQTGQTWPSPGTGLYISTDPEDCGRGGISSGAWRSGYVNFMRDGDFGYNGGPVTNELDMYYTHNHLCNIFLDLEGGQTILSSFSTTGPAGWNTKYGDYGWCGGYLLPGRGMYASPPVSWVTTAMRVKQRMDFNFLLKATNPRATQVRYICNNDNDFDGRSPSAPYYGTGYRYPNPAYNYGSTIRLGVVNTKYDDLHHPVNQFWLADRLVALGNQNVSLNAGRSQINNDPNTRGYASVTNFVTNRLNGFLTSAGWARYV